MLAWFEDMAIAIVLGLIQQFIKNPAKKVAAEQILFHLADSIYESYGVTPPTHP